MTCGDLSCTNPLHGGVEDFVGASLRGAPHFTDDARKNRAPTEGRPYKLGHHPLYREVHH